MRREVQGNGRHGQGMAGQDQDVAPRPQERTYQRIAADLRARIASGEFQRGVSLPSASAMAGEYEVSARTIHRAVRLLVDEGLLVTEAGYGTFLA